MQLRAQLEPALAALHLPTGGYTHTTINNGDTIYAIDFQELRKQIKAAWTLTINWLVTDELGTSRMIFDKTGSLANTKWHDYLPFGEEVGANIGLRTQGYGVPDDIRQKFTSKERDIETGLDYFLARYYSSTQGRFTSTDEFSGGPDELYDFADHASDNPTFYADLTNPQSSNKYQYTYNDLLKNDVLSGGGLERKATGSIPTRIRRVRKLD